MSVLSDGNMILTSMPTEVLATLYVTLHETKHRPSDQPAVATGNLSNSEEALYEAAGEELGARIRETEERRKGNDPKTDRWLVLFPGLPATPEPIIVDGPMSDAKKFANSEAIRINAPRVVVVPYSIAWEGER